MISLRYFDKASGKQESLEGVNGALHVGNAIKKIRDGFEALDPALWDVSIAAGDHLSQGGNTQGSGYMRITKSLFDEGEWTVFTSKFLVDAPVRLALGMSLSQRLNGQHFSFGLVGVDDNGNIVNEIPEAPIVNIASISQTLTTLTVTTSTPHGFVPNDRVEIWGVTDSRANYGEVFVATVTSPTVFTVTATVTATITSATINAVNGSGLVQKIDPFFGANNALGVLWEGITPSNAKVVSRSNKSSILNSAETFLGSNHTNATQANVNAYADAFNPSFMYDIQYKAEAVVVRTFPLDSVGGYGGVIKRSQIVPNIATGYKIRIRARNGRALTKPVARITNIAKTASTIATITTDVPHGLTVLDYVQIYGVRDQVNFANLTTATAVASVVNATTFTIAIGVSATASSKGGSVIQVHGSKTLAPSPQSIQSFTFGSGLLTLIGSATWTGFAHGETVEIHGLVNSADGTIYSAYDGSYKVLSISTTTLILEPLVVGRAGRNDIASTNAGGTIFKSTDLRLHLFRAFDYTRHTVEIDGGTGNYGDYQEAIPVNAVNFSASNTIANGQTLHDSPITGQPVRIGAVSRTSIAAVSATGDAVDAPATMYGVQIMKPYSIPEYEWQYSVAAPITVATDQVVKVAGAIGIKNYVTGFQIINTGATATEYVIKDGATVIFRGYAPASMNTINDVIFNAPLKGTAATALNFACITAGANVYFNAQGYQAP